MSSEDLCGQPSSESVLSEIAFCAFSDPFVVRTPHFELTLAPFENGGLVAVREDGRYLLVTDEELPSSVFFEVRANVQTAYPELAAISSLEGLAEQPPEGLQCQPEETAGNRWVRCDASEFPFTVIRYVMVDDIVYAVNFNSDTSIADRQTLDVMFNSLRIGSEMSR